MWWVKVTGGVGEKERRYLGSDGGGEVLGYQTEKKVEMFMKLWDEEEVVKECVEKEVIMVLGKQEMGVEG